MKSLMYSLANESIPDDQITNSVYIHMTEKL